MSAVGIDTEEEDISCTIQVPKESTEDTGVAGSGCPKASMLCIIAYRLTVLPQRRSDLSAVGTCRPSDDEMESPVCACSFGLHLIRFENLGKGDRSAG